MRIQKKDQGKIIVGILIVIILLSLNFVSADCSDTDGGLNYKTRGTVVSGGNSYQDWCMSGGMLSEYTCVSGYPDQEMVYCENVIGSNWYCKDGACVQHTQSCSDSDGKNYQVKGIVTTTYDGHQTTWPDSCKSSTEVNEEYCENNWVASSSYNCLSFGSKWYCDDGKCNQHQISCSDSDNGRDYKTSGSVTTIYDGATTIWDDACKSGTEVNEAYCYNDWIAYTSYDCKSYGNDWVCRDNKCKQIQQSCSDTDGKDYKTKGIVTTIYDGATTTWPDSCKSSTEVNEEYCENNWVASSSYNCLSFGSNWKCIAGACEGQIEETCTFHGRNYKPGDDACVFANENEECNWHFILGQGFHYYYCQIKDKSSVFWIKTDNQCNMLEASFKCGYGEFCFDGDCKKGCLSDADCKEGEECKKSETGELVCQPKQSKPTCESCLDWAKNLFRSEENKCQDGEVIKAQWWNPVTWVIDLSGVTKHSTVCPIYFTLLGLVIVVGLLIFLIILSFLGITLLIFSKLIKLIKKLFKKGKK